MEPIKEYPAPFKNLYNFTVVCGDGSPAFSWLTTTQLDRKVILAKLNDEDKLNFTLGDVKIKKNHKAVITLYDKPIIHVRGFGKLIGSGGYGYNVDKAEEIIESFAEWIVYKLNS